MNKTKHSECILESDGITLTEFAKRKMVSIEIPNEPILFCEMTIKQRKEIWGEQS